MIVPFFGSNRKRPNACPWFGGLRSRLCPVFQSRPNFNRRVGVVRAFRGPHMSQVPIRADEY